MSRIATTYSRHHREHAEGHLYLDKDGACTIGLVGAASMTQDELDGYGDQIARALTAGDTAGACQQISELLDAYNADTPSTPGGDADFVAEVDAILQRAGLRPLT